MLPAERSDVGQEIVGHVDALATKVVHRTVEIDGVPEDDGGGD